MNRLPRHLRSVITAAAFGALLASTPARAETRTLTFTFDPLPYAVNGPSVEGSFRWGGSGFVDAGGFAGFMYIVREDVAGGLFRFDSLDAIGAPVTLIGLLRGIVVAEARLETGSAVTSAAFSGLDLDELFVDPHYSLDNVVVHTVTAVPEPSTYALMLAGLAGAGFVARQRRRR